MGTCKTCQNETKRFLDLGMQPLANHLLIDLGHKDHEIKYPLTLSFCPVCFMVQVDHVVEPSIIFNQCYPYVTGTSSFMVDHFKEMSDLIKQIYVGEHGFVFEFGSNDGTLLSNFKNYHHLGIDPAGCEIGGLDIEVGFFDEQKAEEVFANHGFANVIISTNAFPHIENRDSVLKGIKKLLHPDGFWINEEVYLGSVIDNGSYDQFYNEHIYTSSILSMRNTVARYGLELVRCKFQEVHGGSMRYFITHQENAMSVTDWALRLYGMISRERLWDYELLRTFARKVSLSKQKFIDTLEKVNGPVVGYGATAKSTTVLNYCNIGPDVIEKIYDTTPEKQGKFTPGMHIPIVSYDDFDKDKPKNVVLFAWNHSKEIFRKEMGKNINWIMPI